mmetsp:Transcript_30529/g.98685  ORF Transcript_30529/g.98685 Transcript_30529/m.98685 type:complete len:208 (-) Transcript_30529:324-947(-)
MRRTCSSDVPRLSRRPARRWRRCPCSKRRRRCRPSWPRPTASSEPISSPGARESGNGLAHPASRIRHSLSFLSSPAACDGGVAGIWRGQCPLAAIGYIGRPHAGELAFPARAAPHVCFFSVGVTHPDQALVELPSLHWEPARRLGPSPTPVPAGCRPDAGHKLTLVQCATSRLIPLDPFGRPQPHRASAEGGKPGGCPPCCCASVLF